MVAKKTYLVGFLLLIVSSSLLYIQFQDKTAIQVGKTYTDFLLFNSTTNASYLGGREYVYLYNGSTQLKPLSVSLTFSNNSGIINYQRLSKFNNSLYLITNYEFNPIESKIENFPLKENHKVLNGDGLKLQYKVTQLKTDKAKTFTGLEANFGNNMKLEWEEGFNSAKVTKSGTFTLEYTINSDNFEKEVRLFDPEEGQYCYQEFATSGTDCGGITGGSYAYNAEWIDINYALDGIWDGHYARGTSSGGSLNITYLKPLGLNVNGNLLKISYFTSSGVTSNLTIDNSCLNGMNNLTIEFQTKGGTAPDYTYVYCLNSTGKVLLLNNTGTTNNYAWIGEEGVLWNVTRSNITIYYTNGTIFNDVSLEEGTVLNLKANITNSSGSPLTTAQVCFSIPSLGSNLGCGNGTAYYNWTAMSAKTSFSDGTTSKIINFTNDNQTYQTYMRFHVRDEILNASWNMHGISDPNYPQDVRVWIGGENADFISGRLIGDLEDSSLEVFSDGEPTKELTFTQAGTQTLYLKLHNTSSVVSGNITLTGFQTWSDFIDADTNSSYVGSDCQSPQLSYDENMYSYSYVSSANTNRICYIYQEYNFSEFNFSKMWFWDKWLISAQKDSDGHRILGSSSIDASFYNYSSSAYESWMSYSIGYQGTLSSMNSSDEILPTNLHNSTKNVVTRITESITGDGDSSYTSSHYEEKIALYQYPKNLTVDSGTIGSPDKTNTSNITSNQIVTLNATQINSHISSCILDTNGYCLVPIAFTVGSAGGINITSVNLTLTVSNNISYRELDSDAFNNYLNHSENLSYIDVPINIYSLKNSSITIDNINISIKGSSNLTINTSYAGNATYSASYSNKTASIYYSDYDIVLPNDYPGDDIIFYTTNLTQSNVSAYSQTNSTPVWRILNYAYEKAFDVWGVLSENKTSTCYNISLSNTSSKSNSQDIKAGNSTNDNYVKLVRINQTNSLDTNLSVYYSFSDYNRTMIRDLSGNSLSGMFNGSDFRDGTLNDTTIWTNVSRWGNSAIKFNGNSRITIGTTADYTFLHNGNDWTISSWVRPKTKGNYNGKLFSNTRGADVKGLDIWLTGRDVRTMIGRTTPHPVLWINSSSILPYDTDWHYLTFVYQNNTTPNYRVYIDGVLKGSGNKTNAPQSGNSDVVPKLGAYEATVEGTYQQMADFYIDGFKVWNRILPISEIQLEMTSENTKYPSNLYTDLEFNENTGTTTRDSNNLIIGEKGRGIRLVQANEESIDSPSSYIISNFTNGLTWSEWIYPTYSGNKQTIVYNTNDGGVTINGFYNYFYGGAGNNIYCAIINSSGTEFNNSLPFKSKLNKWSHVTCVYNQSHIKTCLDGVCNNYPTLVIGNIRTTLSMVQIGSDATGARFYTGYVDEFKLWNRTLSDNEIYMNYKNYPSYRGIWAWTDLNNCTGSPYTYLYPRLEEKAICDGCLYT